MSLPIPAFRTNHNYPKVTKANTGLLSQYKPLKDKTISQKEIVSGIEPNNELEEIRVRFKQQFIKKLANPSGAKKLNYSQIEVQNKLENIGIKPKYLRKKQKS